MPSNLWVLKKYLVKQVNGNTRKQIRAIAESIALKNVPCTHLNAIFHRYQEDLTIQLILFFSNSSSRFVHKTNIFGWKYCGIWFNCWTCLHCSCWYSSNECNLANSRRKYYNVYPHKSYIVEYLHHTYYKISLWYLRMYCNQQPWKW